MSIPQKAELENRIRELEAIIESKYKEGDLTFAENLYNRIEYDQRSTKTRTETISNIAKEIAIRELGLKMKMASFEAMNDLMEIMRKPARIIVKTLSWPYRWFRWR